MVEKRPAFRFLGRTAMIAKDAAVLVSNGNVLFASIQAGIAVVDMTVSILAYSDEKKNTNTLEASVFQSKTMIDRYVKQQKKEAQTHIELSKSFYESSLGQLKRSLLQEEKKYRNYLEEVGQIHSNLLEESKIKEEMLVSVMTALKDVITLATSMSEEEKQERNLSSAELEEQIRITVTCYTKLVQMKGV